VTLPEHPEREWEVGWEGHSEAQAKRLAALSLSQKLEWLERAHRLVKQMQRSNRGADDRESRERNQ
jgi:hypothetical protein